MCRGELCADDPDLWEGEFAFGSDPVLELVFVPSSEDFFERFDFVRTLLRGGVPFRVVGLTVSVEVFRRCSLLLLPV